MSKFGETSTKAMHGDSIFGPCRDRLVDFRGYFVILVPLRWLSQVALMRLVERFYCKLFV